jgi:glycosyltransferase involved in cell wall biosynthesis
MSETRPLRILIVTPSLPYPLVWGFGIRVYQIIKYLAKRHAVTVLAYAAPKDQASIEALRETGATIRAVIRDEPTTSAKRSAQLASLVSRDSFQWQSLASAQMQAALDDLLASQDFDVIQIESSQMFGFRYDSRAPLIVDEHNIEYELLYRTFKTERSPLRKLYNWVEYRKFRKEEQRSWLESDSCVLTSGREQEILRQYAPQAPTLVVPNGVDTEFYTSDPTLERDPNNVVFVGVMHYRPNVDAALYFARDILPLLVRERPSIKFTIVGGGAPDELLRFAGPNLEFTDVVPDTRPYITRAGAFVVPLRMGSGTRLKVLEGLAMRCPMVSTSVGCEGIDTRNEQHLLIADDADSFARGVLRLLNDRALANRLAEQGRALVEARYSWTSVLRELEQFLNARSYALSDRPRAAA